MITFTDKAEQVTKYEYWPTGQVKKEIRPDGSFVGREYDIEGRPTKIWESVPEPNSIQTAGPFGGTKDVALTKTIEYYRGTAMPGGSGEDLIWEGDPLAAGSYISAVRTFTYKGAASQAGKMLKHSISFAGTGDATAVSSITLDHQSAGSSTYYVNIKIIAVTSTNLTVQAFASTINPPTTSIGTHNFTGLSSGGTGTQNASITNGTITVNFQVRNDSNLYVMNDLYKTSNKLDDSTDRYDMVYTFNARGQADKTMFIDATDRPTITRTTSRFYTWRDQVKRVASPDGAYIDNEYDDYKRLTKTKIDGNDEYNAFDYCLCGPVKTAAYHYLDSLSNAQTLDWVLTTDKAGQVTKLYHPYAIAMDGADEYRSILYEHDRAGRREVYSDPTLGHRGADTSGWGGNVEPSGETNWTFDTPVVNRYGMHGNVEALGRVKGKAIMAGQGEPYFVKRDVAGGTSRVLFPDASGSLWRQTPQLYQYTGEPSGNEGTLAVSGTPTSTDGPKKWQITTPGGISGTGALTLDGATVATITFSGGVGSVTYNGITCTATTSRGYEKWTWTFKQSMDRPQMEVQMSRSGDGRKSKLAIVDQSGTNWSAAGPEKHVVEYINDNMGRLARKVSRDTSNDDDSIRWASDYEYNGRGQMVRERILRQDLVVGRMIVTQDTKTTYDLGGNATEVKFADEYGLAYTETRTYGRGYQIANGTVTSARTSGTYQIDVSTAGSYTYDLNGNMLTTKSVDVYFHSSPYMRLAYRGQWTFTYDKMNRLKSHTNTNASNVRVNLWYNAMGQVWQRWNDTSGTLANSLTRYVYDGGMMVQEHHYTVADVAGSWVYTYGYLSRDYLMQPGGIRQKESTDGVTFTDRFLVTDGGVITTQIDRQTSTTIKRIELASSGDRQAGGSQQDGKLSNLWSPGGYLEGYGGGLNGSTGGFDPLIKINPHILGKLGNISLSHNIFAPWGYSGIDFYKYFITCDYPADCCWEVWQKECDNYPESCKEQNIPCSLDRALWPDAETRWFAWCCLPHCYMPWWYDAGNDCCGECGCECCHKKIHEDVFNGIPSIITQGDCGQWAGKIAQWLVSYCSSVMQCACRTFRLQEMAGADTKISKHGNWMKMWGCLFDICSGNRPIYIDCSCGYGGWQPCGGGAYAYYKGQYGHAPIRLCACIDRWNQGDSYGAQIVHELFHHCGGAHIGGQHDPWPDNIINNCWYDSPSGMHYINNPKSGNDPIVGKVMGPPCI